MELFDRAKAHVSRNRTAYIIGTTMVLTGGATYFVTRQMMIKQISIAPVFNNMPTFNNDNVVNFGGPMNKIVRRESDGMVWEKVTDAALANDASVSLMSRHVNGHKPDVYGETYKIIGIGTAG